MKVAGWDLSTRECGCFSGLFVGKRRNGTRN